MTFFVVDGAANRGAVASIEASWAATRGHRLHLFGLALLAGVFNAVLQFVVGLTVLLAPLQLALPVVTTPLWTLALAVIYLRITKQHDDAAATLAA